MLFTQLSIQINFFQTNSGNFFFKFQCACNINGRKISTLYPVIFKILCLILDDKAVCEGYEFTDETTSEDKLPQRKHMPQSPILPGKGCMKVINS